jgi:UTP--glucose-1-phosphate uridylyltransferase
VSTVDHRHFNIERMFAMMDAPMTSHPAELERQLDTLTPAVRDTLSEHAFDRARFVMLASKLSVTTGDALKRGNRVTGHVEVPRAGDLLDAWNTAENRAHGESCLRRGEVAMCVLAGGMATRMGGVVKALVEALPGHTFLDMRLRNMASLRRQYETTIPLWLMTSDATTEPIRHALAMKSMREPVADVATFAQNLSLRLTPRGDLFRDEQGNPSAYATGHGDLVDAIRRTALLSDFVRGGGKYVWIANLDNLGATLDAALLGAFEASGAAVLVEVADKQEGDRGGIPVRVDGRVEVLEEFRLPPEFDAAQVRVFNTNTFLVRARDLLDAHIDWNWFYVEKTVGVRVAVQFERLLQELTSALPSVFARVPRAGVESRFLPCKDHEELAKRRAVLEEVGRARHMI